MTAILGALLAIVLAGSAAAQGEPQTKAIFASGCFWCTQADFLKVDGVTSAVSGYTGGHKVNPTYKEVVNGKTGHYEAVEVTYDPAKVSYAQLLEHFWRNVDPFDPIGQFCDKGDSYRGAIFYLDDEQKQLAEASKKAVETKFGKPVVTAILPAATFYKAEDYHQNYHQTNATQYSFYRWNCGRDQRLKQLWGDGKSS
jgi:peptide-methionine (S)-S-oxide reductase